MQNQQIGMRAKKLVNIGNIQLNVTDMQPQYHSQINFLSSQSRGGFDTSKRSLNSEMRKRQHQKQLAENIMMLKKIHFAQPTIKFADQLKHQERTEKLKAQLSNGSTRQSMVMAARALVSSPGVRRGSYSTSSRRGSAR